MKFHSFIIILGVTFFSFFMAIQHAKTIPFERDEISWYFHTEFFDEAFLKKNINSPIWNGYESFDHPQVSKYIYGAYVYLLDHRYSELREALKTKYGRWDFYTRIPSDTAIAKTEFHQMIKTMRQVNIVSATGISVIIFLLSWTATGSLIAAFLLVVALQFQPLFGYATVVATSDSHMVFFGLLALWFYMQFLSKRRPLWLYGSAITAALSTGAKLNGACIPFGIVLYATYLAFYHQKNQRPLLIFAGAFFLCWILINPALYHNPIQNSWRYFAFRSFQSANIAYHVPEAGLPTIQDRANAIYCTLMGNSCDGRFTNGSLAPYPLINIVCISLGLYFCFKKNNIQIMLLTLLLYINTIGYLAALDNYSGRYFVFLQILSFIIQLYGGLSLTEAVLSRHTRNSRHR